MLMQSIVWTYTTIVYVATSVVSPAAVQKRSNRSFSEMVQYSKVTQYFPTWIVDRIGASACVTMTRMITAAMPEVTRKKNEERSYTGIQPSH